MCCYASNVSSSARVTGRVTARRRHTCRTITLRSCPLVHCEPAEIYILAHKILARIIFLLHLKLLDLWYTAMRDCILTIFFNNVVAYKIKLVFKKNYSDIIL